MAQANYVSPSIRASGTTFAQLRAGGLAAMIARFISANAALSAKAAPTVSATGGGATGGLLEAGSYTFRLTEVTGFGEGPPSTASSSTSVSATNIPRVTMAALSTGASSRRLYIHDGTIERLYATGITTTTYDCAVALADSVVPTAFSPPAVDSSGANAIQGVLGQPIHGQMQEIWKAITDNLDGFTSGKPVSVEEIRSRHLKLAAALKTYATAMDEIGVLLAANPGTIGVATSPSGDKILRRTFS